MHLRAWIYVWMHEIVSSRARLGGLIERRATSNLSKKGLEAMCSTKTQKLK